jgi:hypothetical protein
MYISLSVKYPLFLSDINETSIFSTDYRKNIEISNSLKMRPFGAELFNADRGTDMMTLIAAAAILQTRLETGVH